MTKTVQKTNKNAILLMHCPDQSGIVAVVTDFININGGNILYLDQYVDQGKSYFLYAYRMGFDPFYHTRR